MNSSMQEQWQPKIYWKLIFSLIVIVAICGLTALKLASDIQQPEKTIAEISLKTDQAIGFELSTERTVYLKYVTKVLSQDSEISEWQDMKIRVYFDDAEEAENKRKEAIKKSRIASDAKNAL